MYALKAYEKSLCRWHVWDRLLLIAHGEGMKRVLLTCIHAILIRVLWHGGHAGPTGRH